MENRQSLTGMDMRALRHDLRTPIANVIALAQLSMRALAGDGAEEAVAPYLRRILASAKELERMTGELAGGEAAARERFTAQDVERTLDAVIAPQAAQKGQNLTIDMRALGEGTLVADGAALRHALLNLLGNAVKYTPRGGKIRLTAGWREAGRAEFIVEDDGMGMEPEFLKRMYQPFARSPQAQAQQIPGSGLGLAIVKQMTQRLHGTIEAESEPGKGTRFVLTAPLAQARFLLMGKRFLLAEDSDLCAQIAQEILRAEGAEICRAADGAQAVRLFRESGEGAFDAVLMDMRMPGMDGCAAARAIRGSEKAGAKRALILALTAGGDEEDEREALAAGMDACLRKPIDPRRIAGEMGRRRLE